MSRPIVGIGSISVGVIPVPVRTVWISPIIGTAVVRVPSVVSSIKRKAYSDIPKYAATTAPAIAAPVISVIATVRYNCLAVPRMDNARLGERGPRQRKRENGTEN